MRKVGPAWTVQGRYKETKFSEVPGPGAYIEKRSSNTPSYTISRSNRHDFSKSPQVPGPGTYITNKIETSKSMVFGTAPRISHSKITQLPGPGNYEIKSLISEGPKYSLKGREKLTERAFSPGPGQYNINKDHLESKFIHTFTKEKRSFSAGKDSSPGPGAYEIKLELNHGIKFTSETRGKVVVPKIPGPGAYNLPLINDSKAFSMIGKSPQKDRERSPGPGIYNPRDLIDTKSYSVGKSTRFKYIDNSIPGPGAYSIVVPKTTGSSIFGNAKRETYLKTDNSLGPGAYKIPEKIKEGPAFSLRPKPEMKIENKSPGPGQYNIKSCEKSFSPVFGTSKRNSLPIKNTPGPGQYEIPTKDSQGWKFGQQQRLSYNVSGVPGPGAYSYPLF
ncbi:hypothetical protein SteCoe_25740 [Stentor coeruleus]|uniref:Uncharacterized protein n=1 Tax=Stentor coeruleus TaxID=5963 RepID=A0A1R2BEI9_9CILI|nr:hypothetical protein SteCoe_25740 [Stentor coeruleus]